MEIALTALAAAVIGFLGPFALARLPEPEEPDEDKRLYADLARARGLGVGLAGAAGAAGALVAWGLDATELLPMWAVVCGVGSWLAYIDWHTRLLPYLIVAPFYLATWGLAGLGAILGSDHRILVRALVANVVVYVVFRVLYELGRRMRNGLGYGDVRLAAVLAVALGPIGGTATTVGLYAGFLLGAVGGIVLSALRIVDRTSFAFGPYLVVGAVVGAVWGPRLYG